MVPEGRRHSDVWTIGKNCSPVGICLKSGSRSHFFVYRGTPCRRSLASLGGRRRRSPGSCGATPPPGAAAWSIAQQQRNGTPSEPRAAQGRRSLRSMRHCAPMCRTDCRHGRRSERSSRSWPGRVLAGPSARTTARPAVGQSLEPGADRPPLADRLPER
jgi:hypothetical protein